MVKKPLQARRAGERHHRGSVWQATRWIYAGIIVSVLLATMPVSPTAAATPLRRVNAPYFGSSVILSQAAIFWFGRITPTENYADVRVGYNSTSLVINVAVVDRRLWYDTTPAAADMETWDAVTLYLDVDGPIGTAPDASSYRLVAQLNWWEPRAGYQASYRGNGAGWSLTPINFAAVTGWRGDQPNNNADDRGWTVTFSLPFTSVGLSGPPPQGATWGLGVAVHDRDDSGGTAIPVKVWPETLSTTRSSTWGELVFGLPPAYAPKPYVPNTERTTVVRDRLNGVTVIDGAVGGHTTCGGGLDYWTQWGEKNYAGLWTFNIQNQSDISDWPCSSKYYVSFPTQPVPAGKIIVRATVTLHQFGGAGAGWSPPAQPSLIQAFTVDQAWNQYSLTWNNAPLAARLVARTWVDPTSVYLGQPGKPWKWDVTSALAEAYAAGKPLDLVFYEADTAYHSGKYFRTSEEEEFDAVGRPTLEITWGDPIAELHTYAWPTSVVAGDVAVFNIVIQGAGAPLRLSSRLPNGVSPPVSASSGLLFTAPDLFQWEGNPPFGTTVYLGFAATVTQRSTGAIINRTSLTQTTASGSIVKTATAVVFIDPYITLLPVVIRNAR